MRVMNTGETLRAFTAYQQQRAFSHNTIKRRESALTRLATFVSPSDLLDATGADIEEWLSMFPNPCTRHAYQSDCRALFKWAARRQLVERDPTVLLDPIRLPVKKPKPFRTEELVKALGTADERLRLILLLYSLAGLRRAEVACLDRADIMDDLDPPMIHVSGKWSKERHVPAHPAITWALGGAPRSGWLFPNGKGGHLSPERVGQIVTAHLKSLGIDRRGHSGRHWFGTRLARALNGDMQAVAHLMGHTSIQTTYESYAEFAAGSVAQAVFGLDPAA